MKKNKTNVHLKRPAAKVAAMSSSLPLSVYKDSSLIQSQKFKISASAISSF